jgi:hypothetical protein
VAFRNLLSGDDSASWADVAVAPTKTTKLKAIISEKRLRTRVVTKPKVVLIDFSLFSTPTGQSGRVIS